ncbi:SGNH/GDSL hydrolase family protein [Rhodococcus sp. Q]|uniref:SGNH/GDSL hydrolase family protein n=1 Tax=Rhodococcus sp. Q TaxID=2502252 RepID=UPI0010F9A796|nr:SGNH/GDSL hydrolase family protein [Rhodococcus sp. Q]
MHLRTRTAVVVAAAGCLLAASAGGSVAQPAGTLDYVALGDSAAAGPLIPDQDPATPGCLRSLHNYPSVVAQSLGARLTDVTCSSARSSHIADVAQTTFTGAVPRQVDALTADTDLVTVTIGANDVNLFTTALRCLNPLPEPSGTSCADTFTTGGVDQMRGLVDRAAPQWGETLDEIRAHAPNAEIVVVGYGTYTRPGGCPDRQPMWPRDADYLQRVMDSVNDAMAEQVRSRAMTFVDIRTVTAGHDICADPSRAHYAGAVPAESAAPLHPTALGMQAIGAYVADQLR